MINPTYAFVQVGWWAAPDKFLPMERSAGANRLGLEPVYVMRHMAEGQEAYVKAAQDRG